MHSSFTRVALVAVLTLISLFGACTQSPPSPTNQNQSAVTKPGKPTTTIGVYRPNNTTFYLRHSNTSGEPDVAVSFGPPGALPIVGDWDGDGTTTIGVYSPGEGIFYLRNANSVGSADLVVPFGPKGA